MTTRLEMPIPRSLGETIFVWVITVGVVGFSIQALLNLLSGEDVVASWVWSSLWFAVVIWQTWQSIIYEGGIRKFAINYLGGLAGKHFAEIAPFCGQPTEIWFGFQLFRHRLVQQKVSLEKVESVKWNPGQATAMTGRDKKDWQVCLWFKHDGPSKSKWQKPDDVYIVGPSRRKEATEVLGLAFVDFLCNAGVPLVRGKGDACFVRSGIPEGLPTTFQ